jgi:hypothetical protein
MLDRVEAANSLTEIAGARIELIKRGAGRPLLLLHPAIGITSAVDLKFLSVSRRVRVRNFKSKTALKS